MAGAANPSALCINDVLSHQIMVEVLVRILLRDVFRCLSVCKLWLSWIRDDPYLKKCFILERITEQASNKEDQKLVYVQCSAREMLPVTPTCSILNGSELSLDFLPLVAGEDPNNRNLHLVLGSSNGLLLSLCWPCDASGVVYFICNPLTKQWLIIPPSPNWGHFNTEVGFICDPFYNVQDDSRVISLNDGFGFKVVRLLFSKNKDKLGIMLTHAEIFTSCTGCWTTNKMQSPISCGSTGFPKIAIPYKGKLCWMLTRDEFLVYDPNKNEFLLERLALPSRGVRTPFAGLSHCQDSLWVGKVFFSQLKVYTITTGDSCVKHDGRNLDELHFSLSSSKHTIDLPHAAMFRTMHPTDPMIAYLSVENKFLECNFGDGSLKVVAENSDEDGSVCGEWFNVFVLSLPFWPTPLPTPVAA